MSPLRPFVGTPCPRCGKDILQTAPPKARMPPGDFLWCPGCETQHTLADLTDGKRPPGFFRRLFAGRSGA